MDNGKDEQTILRILDQAPNFFRSHFEREERHLTEKGDPDLELHAQAHKHRRAPDLCPNCRQEWRGRSSKLQFADLLEMVHNHLEQWDHPAFESILAAAGGSAAVTEHAQLEFLGRSRKLALAALGKTHSTY
jgi:hemerythrin